MKIDTTLIEGFDAMSAEEKNNALLNYEFNAPDNSEEMDKLKADLKGKKEMIDKYSSQIADYKKKERESLDEGTKAKLEYEERIKELETIVADQEAKSKMALYTAKYKNLGYDDALAEDTAKAMLDGDMDRVFANGEKHNTLLEKKFKAEFVKKTPAPDDKGGDKKTVTKADLNKMSSAERFKFYQEHPEEYKQLYGGK